MKNVSKLLLGAAIVVLASCGGEAANAGATADSTAVDSTTAPAAPAAEAPVVADTTVADTTAH